jgi:hypothetical protein
MNYSQSPIIEKSHPVTRGVYFLYQEYIATLKERSFQLLKIKGYLRKNDEGKYL